MRRIALLLAAVAMLTIGMTSPASADPKPEVSGKDVTLCHATGSQSNPYTKITVSVNAFFNAGHIDHEGDIWEAFSYIKRTGSETWETINVPAQGDTSLLAFDDCQKPDEDEKIAKPEPVYADPCGTSNDVFSVAPGTGYTVGSIVTAGNSQSITVTLDNGFAWLDGSKDPVTFTKPAFTDVNCDLPNTGGVTVDKQTGVLALAGILLIGGFMVLTGARRRSRV